MKLVVGAVAWAILLWSALQMAHVHTSWDHALCGVWGCGPTLPAVLSCHAAWLIVLTPVALVGRSLVPPRWARSIGLAVSVLVLALLLGIISRESTTWLQQAPVGYRHYFAQRCLFVIATWVDVPLVELGLVGLLWWATPRKSLPVRTSVLESGQSPAQLQPIEIVNVHDYRRT